MLMLATVLAAGWVGLMSCSQKACAGASVGWDGLIPTSPNGVLAQWKQWQWAEQTYLQVSLWYMQSLAVGTAGLFSSPSFPPPQWCM